MDETEREPAPEAQTNEGGPPEDRGEAAPGAPQGQQPWRGPAGGRRRGRRGRGGGGGGGRGPMPGAPPFAPQDDEGSAQMREVGAYERRQQQGRQRGPWRGGAGGGGFRPQGAGPRPSFGAPRPAFGAPRPAFGARPGAFRAGVGPRQQRYQEMVRRATAGPRTGPAEEGGEPISGPHAVLEALRAGRQIRRIYVAQERGVRTGAMNDVIREAQEKRVLVRFVDKIDVERLSPGVEHQGIVAIAEGRAGVELDELLVHLDQCTEPPLVLVIDSLQDPQNFGVLLRSGEGAGVDGVVIPRHRQVGLTPAVARTSAGASEHLLIAEVANLRQAIDALKERGIWVVGTDDTGDMEWDEVDYRGATAIVIGGEGEGIRRLVLEGCDQVVRIPMQGQVSSLNAAAAGTVILFEALRQRMRDAAPPQIERPAVSESEGEEEEEVQPPSAEGQEEQDELPEEVEAPADESTAPEPPKKKAPARSARKKKAAD